MPGTIHIKPIEAKLIRNTSKVIGMDPYCMVKIGNKIEKSDVNYNGGTHPHWNDTLIIDVENELKCVVELRDKTMILPDATVGVVELNLKEIENKGDSSQWYILLHDKEPAGEILLKTKFEFSQSPPSLPLSQNQGTSDKDSTIKTQLSNDNAFSRVYNYDILGPTTEQQASLSSIDELEQTKGYTYDPPGPTAEQQESVLLKNEKLNPSNSDNLENDDFPYTPQQINILRCESKCDYSRNYDFDALGPTTEQQSCLSPMICGQNQNLNKGYNFDAPGPTVEQQFIDYKNEL